MAKMVEKWAKSGCTGAAARAHAWARAGAHACALAAPRATLCATRTRVCADCHAVYNAALFVRRAPTVTERPHGVQSS